MHHDIKEDLGRPEWATARVSISTVEDRPNGPAAENPLPIAGEAVQQMPSTSRDVQRYRYEWHDTTPLVALTEAQTLVAMMLAAGVDPSGIAERLGIKLDTVGRHIRALKRYWNVNSLVALVARLSRAQLMYERSKAVYLFDEVLPILTGAQIEAPFLHDGEWCGLVVRLPNGQVRRVWICATEDEETSGWVRIE